MVGPPPFSDEGACFLGGNGFIPLSQTPSVSFTQAVVDSSLYGKRGPLKSAGIVPLTLKQVCLAVQHPFEDIFSVDGADINIVTLVGMVLTKEEKTTEISFVLDDGTGSVDVKCWIDGQDMHECSDILTVQNGCYVRMYGHLRSLQGKRSIVTLSIRLVNDFNEITFHFLECIYAHLFNVKSMGTLGLPTASGVSTFTSLIPTFQNGPGPAPMVPTFHDGPGGPGRASSGSYRQYIPQAVNTGRSMNLCVKRVQAFFEEPQNVTVEAGLHIEEVSRRMGGFNKKQVQEAVEFLVNEGMIYSTIDDNHYRSANDC